MPAWRSLLTSTPVLAGGVVLVAAALGGGIAALVSGRSAGQHEDTSKLVAARELRRASAEVRLVGARLGHAGDVAGLRSVAKDALGALARVQRGAERVGRLEDPAVAQAASGMLGAQAQLLAAWGQMRQLAAPVAADRQRVESAMRAAEAAVDGSSAKVRTVTGVGGSAIPPTIRATNERTAKLIADAAHKLERWRNRVAAIRRDRHVRLRILSSYLQTFNARIRSWDALRTELSDWIVHVDRDGETFDAAYEFLADAATQRTGVRNGLSALRPPSRVARAHHRVLAALTRAIDAVGTASSGVSAFQYDRSSYASYKDTPGWRAFRVASKQIAREYVAAVATLRADIARQRRGIRRAALPKHPTV
jgi:hypothetical protein